VGALPLGPKRKRPREEIDDEEYNTRIRMANEPLADG
jgi:hypothetical protein